MELSRCLEDHWVFQARCYCLSEISQQSNMRWEGYFLLIVFFKSSEYLYTISSHKRGPLLRMMVWDIWNLETSGWLILFVKMFSILALSTLLQSFWVSVCICMYTIVSIKIHQLSSIGGKKTVFCSCKTWWAFSKPGFNFAHVSRTLKIHQIFFFLILHIWIVNFLGKRLVLLLHVCQQIFLSFVLDLEIMLHCKLL